MTPTGTTKETVVGLFDDLGQARDVVQALSRTGIPAADVNLVAHANAEEYARYFDPSGNYVPNIEVEPQDSVTNNAGIGAMVGALGGLLVGLAWLTVPGIGPVLAAGPLATALVAAGTGTVIGGVLGGLSGLGVDEPTAALYSEGVRRGGSLVVVQTDLVSAPSVVRTLKEFGAIDLEERVGNWRARGWERFDPQAPVYTAEEIAAERKTYAPIV